ncbi:MAG: hypothetical protein A2268_09310 [Candidatus Raymondbacteria bacterium RifOxyA12_full_50_37]|uniref:FlgD Ig-like domain-containing protein n=1 Tax=Candidatus Raymondbacteria bacterium RIFOXYD12_FULL_49_13 TaxID=1817890 RepID=A0A1F7FJG2_UNCRA|nr:MAG: hypothetical protein A2268_09310 [Candidatus Raymondbacteria bacterium RifOxyA12_full_50_37]OGJ90569.1 MAG: hypothetical protein A2248_10245 [Candidatus Raymondbacteria bacterium RIFOXYA2_FULL_49_16]OGJ98105.1 MAG: hypothetical protein A2453_09345 [Candidatus Raymondbacteria bacterium RIFOXYC2_FULL_50_21]OGJ98669.1 MAG: hypothetical protein A2350_14090 [Candidatus Raymondbacteria bacterium RifOxyB12_full_50_8]OGJ99468.1 MAG: hypothetical protein A2487_14740 [Candidatus Raymondbacteria b
MIGVLALSLFSAQPSDVTGFFREGQTFLTWEEDNSQTDEKYRVYRSISQITDISSADLVAEINEGSSVWREMHKNNGSPVDFCSGDQIIDRFVIFNDSAQLSATTGLFVHTVHETVLENYYYAVTTVTGTSENAAIGPSNTCGPISEVKQPTGAVRYLTSSASGTVKEWYAMWLDYALFKENYMGYAFPVAFTMSSFSQGGAMPRLYLDGIGTMNVCAANYANYGQGDLRDQGIPTWYFGYHKSRNFDGTSTVGYALHDTIANYIQYRIIQSALWARRKFNITDPRFKMEGFSMGGSGMYGFFMAFPSFVTYAGAQEGLTQYRVPGINSNGDTIWASSAWGNYGRPNFSDHSQENPVTFLPFNDPAYPELDWVTQYNGMNVYDVRDVANFMSINTAKSFGLLAAIHGGRDGSIPYDRNGAHFEAYIKDSRHCFTYYYKAEAGHSSGQLQSNGMGDRIRWDESRPGFSHVPPRIVYLWNNYNSGLSYYGTDTSRGYCLDVKWGCIDAPIGGRKIEETDSSWSIPVFGIPLSNAPVGYIFGDYTLDITPRNLQQLEVWYQDTFTYEITDTAGNIEASGEIIADSLNLLLIPNVPVRLNGAIAQVTLKSRSPSTATGVLGKKNDLKTGIAIIPNPFNPSTLISFSIGQKYSARTSGKISIFTIRGELVRTMPVSWRIRDGYSLCWDGKGDSGRTLGAGVYLISAAIDGKNVEKIAVLSK